MRSRPGSPFRRGHRRRPATRTEGSRGPIGGGAYPRMPGSVVPCQTPLPGSDSDSVALIRSRRPVRVTQKTITSPMFPGQDLIRKETPGGVHLREQPVWGIQQDRSHHLRGPRGGQGQLVLHAPAIVDGQDVDAVEEAVRTARERQARSRTQPAAVQDLPLGRWIVGPDPASPGRSPTRGRPAARRPGSARSGPTRRHLALRTRS